MTQPCSLRPHPCGTCGSRPPQAGHGSGQGASPPPGKEWSGKSEQRGALRPGPTPGAGQEPPRGRNRPVGSPPVPGIRGGLRQRVRGARAPAVSVRQSCGPAPRGWARRALRAPVGPGRAGGGSRGRGAQSLLRWLLLRTGWPLERGPFLATSSSSSELSVSSRSLRSSSTTFPVMNFWAMRMMR